MAIYDRELGFQSILNAALGDYHAKGFKLLEPDDHTLVLYFQDDKVAVFGCQSALIPAVHNACREHLESLSAS